MSRRPYEEIQVLIEHEGGQMHYERGGHGPGGAWIVEVHGGRKVIPSNGAGFPPMDHLYIPKVPNPTHWKDYTTTLVAGAREKFLQILVSESYYGKPQSIGADGVGDTVHNPEAAPLATPPFEGASEYVDRVASSRHLPERNMEDLVKEFLVRLGHESSAVVFQIGHVDVLVNGEDGKPHMVVEVKRSLQSKSDRDSALRQAFDYANRNGAPIVVVTDADTYEVYDKRKGMDHDSMLCTKFRLNGFRESDIPSLGFLKPSQ